MSTPPQTMDDRIKQGAKIIAVQAHGKNGSLIVDASRKCEQLFAKTVFAGMDAKAFPSELRETWPEFDSHVKSANMSLAHGTASIHKVEGVKGRYRAEFKAYFVKNPTPDSLLSDHYREFNRMDASAFVQHLKAQGISASAAGTQVGFTLKDDQQIRAMDALIVAQQERSSLLNQR